MSDTYFTPTGIEIQPGPPGRIADLAGQEFNRLTVVRFLGRARSKGGHTRPYWLCKCECGKCVNVDTGSLKKGATKSCGCLNHEMNVEQLGHRQTKHGMSKTNIYKAWKGMKERCSPTGRETKNYSDRGITVCERWQSFENFREDMGERPFPGAQLDRIDNDKGYSADNCRWVTCKENQRNRRTNVNLTYQGRTQTIAAWAEETGLKDSTIRYRLRRGWPVERALTTPVKGSAKIR